MIQYALPGNKHYQRRLYPDPSRLDQCVKQNLGIDNYRDVIAHFTLSSLAQDGIQIKDGSLTVTAQAEGYTVSFEPLPEFAKQAEHFKTMHITMLDKEHAGLALAGTDACEKTSAWNPMAGWPVNRSDGPSEWIPCLPLGMPIANHLAVTLLHYPPIVAYRNADYLDNQTLRRWARLLRCVGIDRPELYHAIVDVNPIAAPGSGQSEYPNDYFPINLTSLFFDNDKKGLNYVRSMLELMLNPPANKSNQHTIPLLVCGSPLYDPQAAGWFRLRYKDQKEGGEPVLPRNAHGTPTADVLQVGFIRVNPDSPKRTPYMIANHMIAAGVTGRCTNDRSTIPNIEKYEAQDLVAATFLSLHAASVHENKPFDPVEAKQEACQRWFGAPDGSGAPNPPAEEDRLTLCALAHMDLCFDPKKIAPMYTYEEAVDRCKQKGGSGYSPCFGCDPIKEELDR